MLHIPSISPLAKVALVLLGVASFALWWTQDRAPALTLPDGSIIRLHATSFGTRHPFNLQLPPGSGRWERLKHAFKKPLTFQTDDSVCVFQFTTTRKENGNESVVECVETVLDDGRVMRHGYPGGESLTIPTRAETQWNEGPRTWENGVFRREHGYFERSSLGGQSNGRGITWTLVDPHFDRRAKRFPVRLKVDDQWHHWEFPNPLHGRALPTWQPEPLPIVRKQSHLTLVVNGWKGRTEPTVKLDVEVRVDGRVANGGYSLFTRFEDPTGNSSRVASLSRKERAWKVSALMHVSPPEPLAGPQTLAFPALVAPEPGSHVIIPVPPPLTNRGTAFLALVGPGKFSFQDGVPTPVPNNLNEPECRELEQGWIAEGEVPGAALLIVEDQELGKNPEGASRPGFHARFGAGPLKDTSLDDPPSARGETVGRYVIRKLANWPVNVPPGQIINLRTSWLQTMEAEFHISPPPWTSR